LSLWLTTGDQGSKENDKRKVRSFSSIRGRENLEIRIKFVISGYLFRKLLENVMITPL
jgi:hypothetical protein